MIRARVAVAALVAVTACSAAPDAPAPTERTARADGPVYPGADWQRSSAAAAGVDAEAWGAADRALRADDTDCFVVVKDGRVVHEYYADEITPTTQHAVFSVTKSFTSVLLGIAAADGRLDLDDSAADYVEPWKGTPAAEVTVRDLMANVSGRHWDFDTDYQDMAFAAQDKTAFSIGLTQDDEPGTVWNYNNSAIQTLSEVLRVATGQEPGAYATTQLLGPLQMQHTRWGSDRSGHGLTFAGVSSTCLDLARLGQLMLHDGRWNDRQVVPAEFVEEATTASSDLNAAYGLLWWVNDPGTILGAVPAVGGAPGAGGYGEAPRTGRLAESAPDDTFWALGFGRQYITVLPSEGVVAVRLGAMPKDQGLLPEEFTSLVLAGLD